MFDVVNSNGPLSGTKYTAVALEEMDVYVEAEILKDELGHATLECSQLIQLHNGLSNLDGTLSDDSREAIEFALEEYGHDLEYSAKRSLPSKVALAIWNRLVYMYRLFVNFLQNSLDRVTNFIKKVNRAFMARYSEIKKLPAGTQVTYKGWQTYSEIDTSFTELEKEFDEITLSMVESFAPKTFAGVNWERAKPRNKEMYIGRYKVILDSPDITAVKVGIEDRTDEVPKEITQTREELLKDETAIRKKMAHWDKLISKTQRAQGDKRAKAKLKRDSSNIPSVDEITSFGTKVAMNRALLVSLTHLQRAWSRVVGSHLTAISKGVIEAKKALPSKEEYTEPSMESLKGLIGRFGKTWIATQVRIFTEIGESIRNITGYFNELHTIYDKLFDSLPDHEGEIIIDSYPVNPGAFIELYNQLKGAVASGNRDKVLSKISIDVGQKKYTFNADGSLNTELNKNKLKPVKFDQKMINGIRRDIYEASRFKWRGVLIPDISAYGDEMDNFQEAWFTVGDKYKADWSKVMKGVMVIAKAQLNENKRIVTLLKKEIE